MKTNKGNYILYITSFFFASTLLSFLVLSSSPSFADSVVTTTTINVPESCTMSGTGMTSHTATLINGTYSGTDYSNGIGTTTLKVFCNDSAGFAIYAIGYTNDEYGNTKLHWDGAASTSDTTHDIDTGIYTSGSTTDSTWSMKLSAISGTYAATIDDGNSAHNNSTEDFTNWHEVPDEYERVAYRLSGTDLNTNNNGIGSSITTTYDAYISRTQVAGSYLGKVKYTLVHPASAAAPEPPSVSIEDAFLEAGKTKLNGYYKMQDFSSSICDAVTLYDDDSQTRLIDARDNKVYWVSKLQDDRCWMTQNLDFDLVYGDTLTNSGTDIGWNPLTNSYDSASVEVEVIESVELGDLVWDGTIGSSSTTNANQITDETELHNHLGNLYDWNSAVATNDGTIWEVSEESPDQSICPAYWTLPSVEEYNNLLFVYYGFDYWMGGENDWDKLVSIAGSPIYLIPSDTDVDPGGGSVGTNGGYWTRNVYGISEYSYGLYQDYTISQWSDGTIEINDAYRYYADNVRCVAR